MNLATFKDLCIDAVDAHRLGAFWGGVLGLELNRQDNGDSYLTGPTKAHAIWVNKVPEPKTVKNRLHLDVYGASVSDLEASGAKVVDAESFPWVVMIDPEGGELCLFGRDEPPSYRLKDVVFDCADHERLSTWWVEAIGGERVVNHEHGYSYIKVPEAPFGGFDFVPVPEPKTVKNRVHLDLFAPSPQVLIDHGATLLRPQDDEIGWHVLADPEGNEFCLFTPETPDI